MSSKLKVVLLQPYITSFSKETSQTEPLGLLSLGTYIKPYCEVHVVDLFARGIDTIVELDGKYRRGLSSEKKIIEILSGLQPDVVGITCNFTSYCQDAYDLASLVRQNFPSCRIVIGGAHASMDPDGVMKRSPATDIVVRGEGEVTFKELLDVIAADGPLAEVRGITYRDSGEVVNNPRRELVPDIDSLPMPDRTLIDMDVYLRENSSILPFVKQTPVASMMTTRGCPFECVFCSTKVVWERKWRARSLDLVMDEMTSLVESYGVKEIGFYDDQFLLKKDRIMELCDRVISKKWDITLSIPSGVSGWLLDEELLSKMKEAGFYRLGLSIETGSERTLKFIKKRVDLVKIKTTIAQANRLGFWLHSNFIIGFPFETRDDIEDTVRYAISSGLDFAIFLIAMPHPGAELYDIWGKTGLLDRIEDDSRYNDMETSYYDTTELKAQEIQSLRDEAEKRFLRARVLSYLKPATFFGAFLPKLLMPKGTRYALKIASVILKRVWH